MAFFLALAGALPIYVQSSFLGNYFGISAVTWFFVIANFISILSILIFPKMIKKLGNYLSTGLISFLFLGSLAGLGVSTNTILIFLFFIFMQIAFNLIWINMDIFVESFSSDSTTGRTRTIYFTVINLAWILSPNLSAWLINLNGYSMVYLAAALLITPFLLIFLLKGKRIKNPNFYSNVNIGKTIRKMYKNRNLRGIFWLSMLLNFFFNATTIFMPIYLNRVIGFSWTELGLMFSIMLIPFVLIEIPAGIIADKYLGEKEMFYLGYLIVIVCLGIIFFNNSHNFWFWTALLFASRVGAALIEAMRETYFFKLVDAKDIDKINVYRTTIPLGYLLGSLLSLVIIAYLPISYVFLATGIFLCSAFPFLFMIQDTK
jgi:MFS family permease